MQTPSKPFSFPEPDKKHEKPNDELEAACYANWMRIPENTRRAVIDHVVTKVPVAMMNVWKDQHSRNIRIGSNDLLFHMFLGMSIRNACRTVLLDDDLPGVMYPDGIEYKNWDDFYSGMLQQLVSEHE